MGLPSNECYRIVQDTRGYIWISTDAGLVRYNSKEFVLFDRSKGMPYNNIYALDTDKSGRVWFATGNWNIGYILNDSVHIIQFSLKNYNPVGDLIYKIKYFEKDSVLLISSHSATHELNNKSGQWAIQQVISPQKNRDYLLIEKEEFKYVANLYNSVRIRFQVEYKFPISISLPAQGDSLLLSMPKKSVFLNDCFTAMLKGGDYILAIESFVFLLNKDNLIKQQIKLPTSIHAIHVDHDNNIWIGCKKNGIFCFNNGNLNNVTQHILQPNSVSNIIEDKENGIWATTLENGFYYCANTKIETGSKFFGGKKEVYFSKVVNQHLFLNDDNTPLAVICKDTLLVDPKKMGNSSPHVTDVFSTKKGYFVSTVSGVFSFDSAFKKGTLFKLSNNRSSAAKGIIAVDNSIYAFDNIILYSLNNLKIKDAMGEGEQKMKDVLYVGNSELLVCGKLGLIKYRIVPNQFSLKIVQVSKYGHDINKIFKDSSGNIWLPANSDTLFVIDKNFNLKTTFFLGKKELNCKSVIQQSTNSFLISSNKGIIQILADANFSKYQIKYFEKTNGLPSNDIRNIVFFKGKYYVSTSHGLCSFNSLTDLEHIASPNTVISACFVNDSSVSMHTNMQLPYNKNNVSFIIDALAFKKITQRGTFFKYMLDGLESEFKTATGTTISYNNLPPGNYRFIAKTFYDSNTEDISPAEFSFIIKPAFWQTWWGILLIVLVGAAIVYTFVLWRIKKIKLIEKERTAINQTIAEYRFTALKAQMDPHFIFNSINIIQNLILEKDKTEAYNSLGKFSRLIRMVLNQSDSVFATIEEELALINLYVELNQLRVDYPFIFISEIQQGILSCIVPSLIIQPFIENALWHGILPLKGSKKGLILLKIFKEDNILVMQVKDNGIGRKTSSLNKSSLPHISKGIELIKERLKAYQAMNDNCLAELNIFDLEENGESAGTMVEIKIALQDDETY